MKNLSLRTRLAIGFGIPVLLIGFLLIAGITFRSETRDTMEAIIRGSEPIVTILEEMKFASARIISTANELVLDDTLEAFGETGEAEGDEEAGGMAFAEAEQLQEALAAFNDAYEIYQALVTENNRDRATYLLPVDASGQELVRVGNDLLLLRQTGADVSDLSEARETFEEVEEDILAALDTAVALEQTELLARQEALDTSLYQSTILLFIIAVTITVTTVGVATFLFRSINRPVQRLTTAAAQLSRGNLDIRADLGTRDELGQLAQTFDFMAGQIKQLVSDLEEQVVASEQARAQAEHADQVKSAFLASMSHELRTPLNAVINFTRFVVDGDMGPVNEQQAEMLAEVIGSARHLLNLINDVLDMSKIESGSLNLFIEDNVDLGEILKKVATTGDGLLAGKPVELRVNTEPDLPHIRADRQRILQILLNIVSNACKFTERGWIEIRTRQEKNEVQISITDTGPGIALEDQSLVFEAFKQTEMGLRQGGGTGLGMPISKSLVEAHGGRMWLHSQPGKGTTFYVALPVKSEKLVPIMVAK